MILVLGTTLLIYLIWSVGLENILQKLSFLGWGLIVLLMAEAVAELFHAVSWRYCLPSTYNAFPLPRLYAISIVGYAISYLTPSASLGGDITKSVLLIGNGRSVDAVSSMLVSKLSFAVAHLSFVLIGCLLIVPRITLPPSVRSSVLIGCLILAFGIVAFFWVQRRGKLSVLARYILKNKAPTSGPERFMRYITEVDSALAQFYEARPSGLPMAVLWHLFGYLVGIFQVWYFLHVIAGSAEIVPCIKVWFVGLWFDLLTFAVPMNLGALEAGRIVAFRAIGHEAFVAVAYAVAIRVVQLSLSVLGMATYACLLRSSNSACKSPRGQRLEADTVPESG